MPTTKMTKAFIRQAECPTGRRKITYSDSTTKGLVLELRATGGRTFYCRFHDAHGRQKNVKLGDASIVELETARQRVAEMQNQLALGIDPAEVRDAKRRTPTLRAFAQERYLPFVQGYKRSWKTDEVLLRRHILPAFGDQPMSRIAKYDIATFVQTKRTGGLAPGTVNRFTILLRYIFNLALDWGVPGIDTNPARGVKLFQENNKRERFLTSDEVMRLRDALNQSANKDLASIVTLLLLTGARRGEALTARWDDIDLPRKVWRIPTTKSGKHRHVPLSDAAVALLETLPSFETPGYLFPSPMTGRPYCSVFASWDTARKAAGLPELRMHDLRHSFASFLVNSGHSLYLVQKLLGHHSIAVTERYAHLAQDTLQQAANGAAVQALGVEHTTYSV